MPLIKCPMCEKDISPNAESCPNCGEPMKKNKELIKNSDDEFNKSQCSLILINNGRSPIKIIKRIREVTGYGLKDAKDCTDNIPSVILKDIDYLKAAEIKNSFEILGATMEISSENGDLTIDRRSDAAEHKVVEHKNDTQTLKCPKCGSTQITAGNKGFGLGKAAIGGILLGPVGLLGGVLGSKKVLVTCLKCGKQWKAGK